MIQKFPQTPIFFGILFLLVIYLLWLMAQQMLGPIVFGAIMAGIFYPLHYKIRKRFNSSSELAATLTCVLIALVVILPLVFILISLGQEAVGLYQTIVTGLDQKEVNNFLFGEGIFASSLKNFSESLDIELDLVILKEKIMLYLKEASGGILLWINSLIGNLLLFSFDIVIMIIVIFALLVEGPNLKRYIFELSPLPVEQEEKILTKFNQMNYVTLVCNGIGAIMQGVLAGIVLWIAGIQSLVLWTVIMTILAFIPIVGISIVTLPIGAYLILTGKIGMGIFVLLASGIISLIVENWFKPKFIGNRVQINSIFILLTIIGGMNVFGMAGIFYGPIIGILFLTMVEIYQDYYKSS